MNKNYDDFTKMKPKEMSKTISDMTYNYINPETNLPTIVPASHYEKILNKVREEVISEETKRIFLTTIYTQLKSLKDEEPKYFQQALLCLDLGLNPKDLRNNELIGLLLTSDSIDQSRQEKKKNFHLIDKEYVETYEKFKDDRELHAEIIGGDSAYERDSSQSDRNENRQVKYKFDMR